MELVLHKQLMGLNLAVGNIMHVHSNKPSIFHFQYDVIVGDLTIIPDHHQAVVEITHHKYARALHHYLNAHSEHTFNLIGYSTILHSNKQCLRRALIT